MIYRIPAILIALTIHEVAHGYTAKILGDLTAEREGRLTLNPIAHLDIFGAMMLMFGPFGWAKPVPVNPFYFKNPKRDMAIVAAAGPLSNVSLAAVAGMMYRIGIVTPNSHMDAFLWIFFLINIGLAIFNLLPVYPLDGSRILVAFLNKKQLGNYLRAMNYVPKIFLGMIVAEWLLKIPILSYLLNPIFLPAFNLAKKVFIGI